MVVIANRVHYRTGYVGAWDDGPPDPLHVELTEARGNRIELAYAAPPRLVRSLAEHRRNYCLEDLNNG